ncbi:YceI family protein [Nitratifractor sp.]|uniref:YceI family protein n=1 Tax=Nitratifractor sp. TaxID=2268144 RepID=UPI0025DC00B4|nr:YceI family protein [Nitratifractor sp.]
MKKFLTLLALVAASLLSAASLHLDKGYIRAHTEVFGDSSIDPATSRVHASLSVASDPASLHGTVWIRAKDLRSDNHKRDEHMYEAMAVKKYPKIRFTIAKVRRQGSAYLIEGTLTLHGTSRRLKIPAKIVRKGKTLELRSRFRILMSDYGIQPPKLMFLTVRDAVDITVYLRLHR